jgi:hypothetical protein
MNRVDAAIEVCRVACLQVDFDTLDKLAPKLDMDIREHATWQEKKSIRQMDGTITLEESMTLYRMLGNSADAFNRKPTYVKIAITKVLQALIV